MATTGETIWASLIARKKILPYQVTGVKAAYLSFSFGRYTHYRTPMVPLRDFRLSGYVWDAPLRVRPGVYLHFVYLERFGRLREEVKFKLSWPCLVTTPKKGAFRYRFPLQNRQLLVALSAVDGSKYSGVKNFYLTNRRIRFLLAAGSKELTPLQLFNLSLIAGVLSPRGVKPLRLPKPPSEPYARKIAPRPNPEIRKVTLKFAREAPGLAYSESTQTWEIFRRAWTGTTTPFFGTKRQGQLPVNGHTVDLHKTTYNVGYDRRRPVSPPNSAWSSSWGGDLYFGTAPALQSIVQTEPEFAQVENAAIKKLNANANLGVQANMAQNLAQYGQTVNMITNTVTRITGSMLALRKGQFARARDFLVDGRRTSTTIRKGKPSESKSLANNWLELQYGWKPLLSDVEKSMEGLANYMVGSSQFQTVAGAATLTRDDLVRIGSGIGGIFPPIGVSMSTSKWQCRFGCRYRVSSHVTSFLSQLGFTNPINLVWEILPYSFVVDWFLPIGPYLESMSAPHGLEFQTGYRTKFGRRCTIQSVAYKGITTSGTPVTEVDLYGERSRESVTLNRTRLTAWPVQSFPTFKNPLSVVHAFNALALLRQAFTGKR